MAVDFTAKLNQKRLGDRGHWQGKGLVPDPAITYGFIYLINDTANDKRYIGRKVYWNKTRLAPLKGKTRKRVKWVESTWRDYAGSSKELLEEIDSNGDANLTFHILAHCPNMSTLRYMEVHFIMASDSIVAIDTDDEYLFYNGGADRLRFPPGKQHMKDVIVYKGWKGLLKTPAASTPWKTKVK